VASQQWCTRGSFHAQHMSTAHGSTAPNCTHARTQARAFEAALRLNPADRVLRQAYWDALGLLGQDRPIGGAAAETQQQVSMSRPLVPATGACAPSAHGGCLRHGAPGVEEHHC
jgi:hypothetical protein